MFGFSFAYNGVNPALTDSGASIDPDAQAFFTATGITDSTQKNAVNQLVLDLKTANIWSKMKAFYPMVGGTATTHKFNLINPADTNGAFRLTFTGGWVHGSNGALPNGTNSFANTFIVPGTNLTLNNVALGYYSRSNTAVYGFEMGVVNGLAAGNPTLGFVARANTNQFYGWINKTDINRLLVANSTGTGLFILNSNLSTTQTAYRNGVSLGSNAPANSAVNTYSIYLGAINSTGVAGTFGNKESAGAFISDGLSTSDISSLQTIIQTFNTTLGRQV